MFRRMLGIDEVMDILHEHTSRLEELKANGELLSQQQHILQHQQESIHLQNEELIQNTRELDKLRDVLLEMERKAGSGAPMNEDLAEAKRIAFGLVSESDVKYLEAIRNLGSVTANDLARILGVRRGTTSAKLSELYQRGLVTKVQRGREVRYSVLEERPEEKEQQQEQQELVAEANAEERPRQRKRKQQG